MALTKTYTCHIHVENETDLAALKYVFMAAKVLTIIDGPVSDCPSEYCKNASKIHKVASLDAVEQFSS